MAGMAGNITARGERFGVLVLRAAVLLDFLRLGVVVLGLDVSVRRSPALFSRAARGSKAFWMDDDFGAEVTADFARVLLFVDRVGRLAMPFNPNSR